MRLPTLLSIGILLYASAVRGQDDYRLPQEVKPSAYDIKLTLEDNFHDDKVFTGSVEITLAVTITEGSVEEIILNAVGIEIEGEITLTPTEGDEIEPIPLSATTDEELQRISLKPTDTAVTVIPEGTYTLDISSYKGKLYEDMYGFYLSEYTNADGEPEYIATTQFQTTYARRAFPCFDEPNFKATFTISIARPADYNTLSNGKLVSSIDNVDTFATTPEMSTYLVAFIVSKFKGYGVENAVDENLNDDGEKIYDVYCREDALPTAEYSHRIGPKILEALNTITDLPYYSMTNTEKMHQVAIPDFSAGAMENWGLVTYRETALLWDETKSTESYKQRVATVIAHEFTHMWFGDLVTLDWWSYTWLNEGFARYYQYFAAAKVDELEDWELEEQFVVDQQQSIFASDALVTAPALNADISETNDYSGKFASYSYNKGASVIRMMRNFLGETVFEERIRDYLLQYSYRNVVPENLFTILANGQEDLPADLNEIMDAWTNKGGYPVVKVTRSEEGITFTQERFLLDSAATDDTKWYVPLTFTTSEEPKFEDTTVKEWLHPDQDYTYPIVNHTGWILVNILETGYYRVMYDDELWDELEEALLDEDFSNIPEINRAQIVDDALNLARANKITYSRALNLTMFLQNDVSYYPWYSAFTAFSFLRRRIDSDSDAGKYLTAHITTLMEALNQTVTFESVGTLTHIETLKAVLVLQWLCELGEETCTATATQLFESSVEDDTAVNPNLKSIVYCSAIREAESRDFWDSLWKKFQETTLATEQITILTALGCTQDADIINEYLGYSINASSGIRKQDASYAFTGVLAGNPGNVDIALEFLSNNVEDVVAYYNGMNALTTIINGIADRLTTEAQVLAFETFLTDKAEALSAVSGKEAALANAKANLDWATANVEELEEWLNAQYGSAASVTLNLLVLTVALVGAIKNFF